MTFEKYLTENFDNNTIDFSLTCNVKNGETTFYIHPSTIEGVTRDYIVKGNNLIPIASENLSSGRFFAPITKEELASKITGAFYKYNNHDYENWLRDYCGDARLPIEAIIKSEGAGIPWRELSSKIKKDLSKCEFDFENVSIKGFGYCKSIVGFNTLPNGMTYLGIFAGGDWERPVYFIIYYSGKELRAYIPTEGNTWNTDTKKAYGNGEIISDEHGKILKDEDDNNSNKRFGVDHEYTRPDAKIIKKDIIGRIKLGANNE